MTADPLSLRQQEVRAGSSGQSTGIVKPEDGQGRAAPRASTSSQPGQETTPLPPQESLRKPCATYLDIWRVGAEWLKVPVGAVCPRCGFTEQEHVARVEETAPLPEPPEVQDRVSRIRRNLPIVRALLKVGGEEAVADHIGRLRQERDTLNGLLEALRDPVVPSPDLPLRAQQQEETKNDEEKN